MSTPKVKSYSPDQLLDRADEHGWVLFAEKLERKAMGAESDSVAGNRATILWACVSTRELGTVLGAETAYRCFPDHPNRVRTPDVSSIASGRSPGGRIPKGYITVPPDLADDSISPRDIHSCTERRIRQLLDAVLQLLWGINTDNRAVKLYDAGSRQPDRIDHSRLTVRRQRPPWLLHSRWRRVSRTTCLIDLSPLRTGTSR